MSGLRLSLFGSPRLTCDGAPLRLHSRKCLALLAYLAVTDTEHSREALATLLWPEFDSLRARGAFRSALSRLRRALSGGWLLIRGETVGLHGAAREVIDVTRFRDLLAECLTHGHLESETCPRCLSLLDEAATLYQGDFMAGFSLPDSPQFDDWQSLEAQTLRRELAGALQRLAEAYATQGSMERAITLAQRWLALDSLDEAAHRCLMWLYAESGRHAAALRQAEAAAQSLEQELGMPLSEQTKELLQTIREGRVPRLETSPLPFSPGTLVPRSNLPPHPMPFVGREEELAQIERLLAEPSCRLLSVVGPGGIGKSRLAIQAAQEQHKAFHDGVWFVPLAPVAATELLASTICNSLELESHASVDPESRLLRFLESKRMLFVLDNFEHLLEGAILVGRMLGSAPGIKVLVTSRQRLNLREEWLLPLQGMGFPRDVKGDAPGQEKFDAVQLFAQCARRVRPGFSLATKDAAWLTSICRLVEGMPLAIELAAPWIRLMSCREIAAEIESGLDFLSTSLRDMPQRHRSMRAVLDHSWNLLSAEERMALARLSVFRGGFRREAAEAVAGVSLADLSGLVDSSWLAVAPSGRYQVHEFVRQYASERLQGDQGEEDADRVRDCHSSHFAVYLAGSYELGRRRGEALRRILEDMDNIWAAWRWAVERGDVETIGLCAEALGHIGEVRGWYHDVTQALVDAAIMLRRRLRRLTRELDRRAKEATTVVLAAALTSEARLRNFMGERERAMELCTESLVLLEGVQLDPRRDRVSLQANLMLGLLTRLFGDNAGGERHLREALDNADRTGDPWTMEDVRYWMGVHAHNVGRYAEARCVLEQAIAMADRTGEQFRRAGCLDNLSIVSTSEGDYRRARALAEETLRIRQQIGDRRNQGYSLVRLGEVATASGDFHQADLYFQRSLEMAREIGDPGITAESLRGQANLALATGRYQEAADRFSDVVALGRSLGGLGTWIDAVVGLGHASLGLGEIQQARARLHEGLATARAARPQTSLRALLGVAVLLFRYGENEQVGPSEPTDRRALELLTLVLHHPSSYQATKDEAQGLLAELESTLSPQDYTAATARGRGLDLEETVAAVLAEQAATH